MLIQARWAEPIRSGRVTVLFRRWTSPRVVAGRVYRTAVGRVAVDAVDLVKRVTVKDAKAAGYRDPAALAADLRGGEDRALYRIRIRPVDEPDPRAELAAAGALSADDVAAITARLDRLDRASSAGAWTRPTLRLIAERPGVRAGDLAASVGREMAPFKLHVRKLKNLGLTLSLEIGYRLSPRGEAYLNSL
ncbi:ASCH domain-containing protein [Actinokineospora guangxiensis]|uniref:ASCH domain-containing protein n=1 Tax=Actinokineospora guangxiensis TaxID=1490288 RepID=A0ABW0EM51_9PSEU